MAIDQLQEKIRKTKNPLILDLDCLPEHIPPHIISEHDRYLAAYESFCKALLSGLKGYIVGVRFSFGSLALQGEEGVVTLKNLLNYAKKCGYYVILDAVASLSAQNAETASALLLNPDSQWTFDGLTLSAYIGSDGIVPYVNKLKQTGKDLFVVVRTANRSAPELQDLLTGSRLVHMATADVVNRYCQPLTGVCGYSQVALVAGASSADSLRSLRSKFKNMFLLLDGSDYPNANAKNCSFAFDKLGHGAAVCVGSSVTAAWKDGADEQVFVNCAIEAAQRFKKNIGRYITIL